MLQSIDGVDALSPVQGQQFTEEIESEVAHPNELISSDTILSGTVENPLAKGLTQIASLVSKGLHSLASRQFAPTRHVLVVG